MKMEKIMECVENGNYKQITLEEYQKELKEKETNEIKMKYDLDEEYYIEILEQKFEIIDNIKKDFIEIFNDTIIDFTLCHKHCKLNKKYMFGLFKKEKNIKNEKDIEDYIERNIENIKIYAKIQNDNFYRNNFKIA